MPSSGNIKTLGNCTALPWAFIPTGTGGSGTTYVPDYVNSDSGWCVLCVGGYYRNDAANCGLFFFNGNYNSSNANSNIGARLLVCMLHFFAQALPHRLVKILPLQDGL